MKILDIDLDFFLNNKHCGTVTNVTRLSDQEYIPWSPDAVEKFLEGSCGLSKTDPIDGNFFTHHDEVFFYLRRLQEQANFSLRFSIDHLDAHADLGSGDTSYIYIAQDILSRPLKDRPYPDKMKGWEGLSAGNYLVFLAACQWVDQIRYINNVEWMDDIQWFNFKDFDIESNAIQLKHFSVQQMNKIVYENKGDMIETARSMIPLVYEPEIPFITIDYKLFKNIDKYDHIFLTHSPGFTSESSDKLIPVIQKYFTTGMS